MWDWAKRLIGGAPEQRAVTDISALLFNGGSPTQAGEIVGPDTALRCPAVYASVSLLADSVAMLGLHLYRRLPDGGKERAVDDPRYALVHMRAAPWLSAFKFRHRVQCDLARHGNGLAFINRATDGRSLELLPLSALSVTVATDAFSGEPAYTVNTANGSRTVAWRDVLHLTGLVTTGATGNSPILLGREAIGLSLTLEKHAARQWGKGVRPSSVVKPKAKLSDEALTRLRALLKSWRESDSGGTLILPDDFDFESFVLTSVDGQFMEQRRFQIAEIARLWRIPLHMIGDLEKATFSNIEEQARAYLQDCLLPILKQWEQELNLKLLTEEEQGDLFFEFLIDDLARADIERRFGAYAEAVGGPWLTADEVRAMENKAPIPGGNILRTTPGATAADGDTTP